MRLKESKREKVTYSLMCVFVLFMPAKKREKKKIEKKKSPHNVMYWAH